MEVWQGPSAEEAEMASIEIATGRTRLCGTKAPETRTLQAQCAGETGDSSESPPLSLQQGRSSAPDKPSKAQLTEQAAQSPSKSRAANVFHRFTPT